MGSMEKSGARGVLTTEQTPRALDLVRAALDQLAAEIEAEAIDLSGSELLLRQALVLPRRAAALRDLSIDLWELVSLERRQLGIDRGEAARLVEAIKLLVARVVPPAVVEARADGQ